MTTHREYHAAGVADDPRDVVWGSSQVVSPCVPGGSWGGLLRQVTGQEKPPGSKFFDMGSLLHAMVLEGVEPEINPVAAQKHMAAMGLKTGLHTHPLTWTAEGLGKAKNPKPKVCSLDGLVRLGRWLIPPPAPPLEGANSLTGIEQRRVLIQLAGELDLELLGTEGGHPDTASMTTARRSWEDARADAEWLLRGGWWCRECGAGPNAVCGHPAPLEWRSDLPPSAQHARYLLCDAPGIVERPVFAEWRGLKLRAKPDKLLGSMSGEDLERMGVNLFSSPPKTIVDIKRLSRGNAHPRWFWAYSDKHWIWERLAFYELVLGRGDEPARYEECPECDGTGEIEESFVGASDNTDIDGWTETCGHCGGSGGASVPKTAAATRRPWIVVTIDPDAQEAYVYACSEQRQERARARMLGQLEALRQRVEGERGWHSDEAEEPVQADPMAEWEPSGSSYDDEDMDAEIPWIQGVEPR